MQIDPNVPQCSFVCTLPILPYFQSYNPFLHFSQTSTVYRISFSQFPFTSCLMCPNNLLSNVFLSSLNYCSRSELFCSCRKKEWTASETGTSALCPFWLQHSSWEGCICNRTDEVYPYWFLWKMCTEQESSSTVSFNWSGYISNVFTLLYEKMFVSVLMMLRQICFFIIFGYIFIYCKNSYWLTD